MHKTQDVIGGDIRLPTGIHPSDWVRRVDNALIRSQEFFLREAVAENSFRCKTKRATKKWPLERLFSIKWFRCRQLQPYINPLQITATWSLHSGKRRPFLFGLSNTSFLVLSRMIKLYRLTRTNRSRRRLQVTRLNNQAT